MSSDELQKRTMAFSLLTIDFFKSLPGTTEAQLIGKQLLRSATSVASNYRAARRGRSRNEFFAKLCIVVEESDETLFWLEMLKESKIVTNQELDGLIGEAKELLYIFSASRKSTRENMNKSLNH